MAFSRRYSGGYESELRDEEQENIKSYRSVEKL